MKNLSYKNTNEKEDKVEKQWKVAEGKAAKLREESAKEKAEKEAKEKAHQKILLILQNW